MDLQGLRLLSEKIFSNAKSFHDTLNTQYIVISSLAYSSQLKEALERGRDILSQLGVHISDDLSPEELDRQTQETISLFMSITPESLLDYKVMRDANKNTAMRFLLQLLFVTHHIKPALYPFLVLKMVKITVEYGTLALILTLALLMPVDNASPTINSF
jgi:predicted ATPase